VRAGNSLARAVPGRSEDDGVRIDFRLEQSGTARLTVHDVSGRLVRVLMDEQRPSGEHSAVWDQMDANRQRVNRGVYFWRLHVQDATETGRIVLLR